MNMGMCIHAYGGHTHAFGGILYDCMDVWGRVDLES